MLHDYVFELGYATPARYTWANFPGTQRNDLLVRRERYDVGKYTGEFRHLNFYALYVVRGGSGLHVINGHSYVMTRGDAYIMPPRACHYYRNYEALELDAFYFKTSVFHRSELPILHLSQGFWNLFVRPEPYSSETPAPQDYRLHLMPKQFERAQTIINEMRLELEAARDGAVAVTRNEFFKLLILMSRWGGAEGQSTRQAAPQPIPRRAPGEIHAQTSQDTEWGLARVLRFCEEHFHEPLTVPKLAAMMFVSPGHFHELFKNTCGISPAAYIRQIRLEHAKNLLRTTDLPMHEIAVRSGFTDTAQFSRSFHKMLGETPSAYRKAIP